MNIFDLLNKFVSNDDIEYLKNIGINFFTNRELGKDIHIHSLKENYDAIFLGIGAEIPSKYNLGDYENIYNPDEFLKAYYNNKFPKKLKIGPIVRLTNSLHNQTSKYKLIQIRIISCFI